MILCSTQFVSCISLTLGVEGEGEGDAFGSVCRSVYVCLSVPVT